MGLVSLSGRDSQKGILSSGGVWSYSLPGTAGGSGAYYAVSHQRVAALCAAVLTRPLVNLQLTVDAHEIALWCRASASACLPNAVTPSHIVASPFSAVRQGSVTAIRANAMFPPLLVAFV
jgi:hypothetical protein